MSAAGALSEEEQAKIAKFGKSLKAAEFRLLVLDGLASVMKSQQWIEEEIERLTHQQRVVREHLDDVMVVLDDLLNGPDVADETANGRKTH